MFILVKVVIKDKKSPINSPIYGVVEKSIPVSSIHNFRPWHRTSFHTGIEGEMIKVNMIEVQSGSSEPKRYFEIVNEDMESFTERVNKLRTVIDGKGKGHHKE